MYDITLIYHKLLLTAMYFTLKSLIYKNLQRACRSPSQAYRNYGSVQLNFSLNILIMMIFFFMEKTLRSTTMFCHRH